MNLKGLFILDKQQEVSSFHSHYVSYWTTNGELDCIYGTYEECQRFIEGIQEDPEDKRRLSDAEPQNNF